MNHYLLSVWTGVSLVKEIANKMREAGLIVCFEATDRIIYFSDGIEAAGSVWNSLVDLMRKHGTDFGLKPIVIRQVTEKNYNLSLQILGDEGPITRQENCPPTLRNDR